MKYDHPQLRQMLAAEYALGTLRGAARRRFERIASQDAAFRAEVRYWDARLAELGQDLRPVAPPASVWLSVQHRVQLATPKVTPIRVTERKPVPVQAPAKPASLWRIGAGLASAAAVVAAVMIGQRIPLPGAAPAATDSTPPQVAQTAPAAPSPAAVSPAAAPVYVALLKLPDSTMQWTLSLAPQRGRVNIAASGAYAKLGKHSLELWMITPSGPVSLGLLPVDGISVLTMPNTATGDTVTLAVSLEPVGGSPTGKPTGPVLTSGPAVKAA
ncbi:MAG: anti-sigma factor [Nevskia sp.]